VRPWTVRDRPGQDALLPVNIGDLLPAGHLAFEILDRVGELDLSRFVDAYRSDGRGRPPYDPAVMVGLLLYSRAKGATSNREVEASCYDDVGARLITGNRYPDRTTIDRFVTKHGPALRALLPQTLRTAHAEGMLDVSFVAGDGTKVIANASMAATVDEATLVAQIAELGQQLAAAQQLWTQQVGDSEAPPTLFADTTADTDLLAARPAGLDAAAARTWQRLCTLNTTLRSRQTALAHLRDHPNTDLLEWKDKLARDRARADERTANLEKTLAEAQAAHDRRLAAEASGAKLPGSRPASVDDHARVRQARKSLAAAIARAEATAANPPTTTKVNTTDPSSRIMPRKGGGYDQLHNVQALGTRGQQLILAIGTHDSPNDKQALVQLLVSGRDNLDAAGVDDEIGTAAFDNGYASEENFNADLPVRQILVAVEREARQTGRLKDATSTAALAWKDMTERLDEADNRKLYKQRSATIEPIFAQLFARFGRSLDCRGDDVDTELHVWAVTHNLLKIIRHRRGGRTRPRPG
jgi:transposase